MDIHPAITHTQDLPTQLKWVTISRIILLLWGYLSNGSLLGINGNFHYYLQILILVARNRQGNYPLVQPTPDSMSGKDDRCVWIEACNSLF
ncbi:hypothetical protein A4H96_12370 [Acidithiobacillus ferrooxidans]|uniref:Uncharacterized protein n=1 Tax=Acidithiobacillus ferrooxidans TaxID=920 RepID=A0A179B9M5_ACIFR|nr:hypothetical protein A4H96_12370 [Acidithiobacillus ferrooxidans]